MQMDEEIELKINRILKEVFGFNSFRAGQKEIIINLVKKKDVLAIMPTGSGKSICYYVPALINEGITLVISPLIALMQDQVNFLNSKGIKAKQINSCLAKGVRKKIILDVLNSNCKILYIAPERLINENFFSYLNAIKISMVVIDEAHCITAWGHDFRPAYVKMCEYLKLLPKRPVIACFTATATKNVREEIINLVELKNPFCFIGKFDRSNLFLDVFYVKERHKILKLLNFLKDIKNENIIIYCATRQKVENIYKILFDKGYLVSKYHAGLKLILRKRNQEYFLNGTKNILVATNAFGMGVDKKDIRYIIHFNMPKNLENYYQEVGRAGRDGKPSKCVMFYSDYDFKLNSFFIEQNNNKELTKKQLKNVKLKGYEGLKKIIEYCEEKGCYRKNVLKYFGEKNIFCNNCGNCLKLKGGRLIISYFSKILKFFKRGRNIK